MRRDRSLGRLSLAWLAAAAPVGLVLGASALWVTISGLACSLAETSKGEGEPCTRSSECAPSLGCARGVCTAMDAGPVDAHVDFVDASLERDADASGHDASAVDPPDAG